MEEKARIIRNYLRLTDEKIRFDQRWGMRKRWHKHGELDNLFRQAARLGILQDVRAELMARRNGRA